MHEPAMKLIRDFQQWHSLRRPGMFVTQVRNFLPILAAAGTLEKMLLQWLTLGGFQNPSRKQSQIFFMMTARIHKRFLFSRKFAVRPFILRNFSNP